MDTKISDLMPDVASAATSAIQTMLDRHVGHAVTSTLRTLAEQQALFAQGRELLATVNLLRSKAGMTPLAAVDNEYTVTNCDGVVNKSNHQGGRALDIVPINEQDLPVWPIFSDVRWKMIATVMKEFGFTWGGDWTGTLIDPPHYEMA